MARSIPTTGDVARERLHRPFASGVLFGWEALGSVVLVSALLRTIASAWIPTPWITPDEVVYAELGRSLVSSGEMTLLGEPTRLYSLVYPALIGGPLSLGSIEAGYALTKGLQAVLMSLCAVPVYAWSLQLMARRWAFLAAVLTVALPGLAYSGLLMTEVVFYPVVVLAAWMMARALVSPTLGNQALVVAGVVLAVATRIQALVLVPAFITAVIVFMATARLPRRAALQWAPSVGILLGGAALWVGVGRHSGGTTRDALGAYRAAAEVHYSVSAVLRFTVYHVGDLLLLTGIIPALACVLAFAASIGRRDESSDVRAFVAVACALIAWIVVEVGTFASGNVGGLAERGLLALAPLVFIGFGLWLEREGERAPRSVLILSVVSVGVLAYMPMRSLSTSAAIPNALTMAPFHAASQVATEAPDVLAILAGLAALLLLVVVRRPLVVLPVLALLALISVSALASVSVARNARTLERRLLGSDPGWIDHTSDGPVRFLYGGDAYWNAAYESAFWNRHIVGVDTLPGFPLPGPFPSTPVGPRADGRLVYALNQPLEAERIVTSNTLTLFGNKVSENKPSDWVLWQVESPPRVSTWITGIALQDTYGDRNGNLVASGGFASQVRLVVYDCRGGTLRLELTAGATTPVDVRVDDRRIARIVATPHQVVRRSLQVNPSHRAIEEVRAGTGDPGQCTIDLFGTGYVAVPRLAFARRSAHS
jgi:hypothetical protein